MSFRFAFSFTQTQPPSMSMPPVPPSTGVGGLYNDPSPGASLPTEIEGLGSSRKMSSFDRIVEKLAPSYPQCSK